MHLRLALDGLSVRPVCAVVALVATLLCAGSGLSAQRFRRDYRMATAESFDGAFQFCRVAYRGNRARGSGWSTDYPNADLNLSTRLGELTKTPISIDKRTGGPNHVIVQLTDPLLFRCPFVMMAEVGTLLFQRTGCGQSASISDKGRVPLGRRFLGSVRLGKLGERDSKGSAVGPIPDQRSAARSHDLSPGLHRRDDSSDPLDQLLAGQRRRHL